MVGQRGYAIKSRLRDAIRAWPWRRTPDLRAASRIPAPGGLWSRRRVGRGRLTWGRKARRPLVAGLLVLVMTGSAAWVAVATSIQPAALLYLAYLSISLVLGGFAVTTLVWMLHAWRTPESFAESRLHRDDREPAHSFSLIVPARHEQAVLEVTLGRLIQSDHPAFEVVVVVGDDDPATRDVAERMAADHPQLVKVVVDASCPKSKPKALNAALPHCRGTITGVFDAEDDVHPALLQRVDQCFQGSDADIVQAGVQLMNFRSRWFTVHNVLEYYFWFRSRLHLHARQRFIPLGGNTVFIRTQVLRAVDGWDPECLAEDCELGVRLSALGARTVVFYEPELVTREECPPTLRAFVRQRTRWNQGYLQTFSRGYWRRLPLRQRGLGVYILMMPYVMAIAWLFIPVAIATAVTLKAPVPITLASFLPLLPMLSMLVAEVAALGEFCRAYGERPSVRDYGRLVLGLPLYQAVLAFAAARAVTREARGAQGWEKTAHLGLHLTLPGEQKPARSGASLTVLPRRAAALAPSPSTAHHVTEADADAVGDSLRIGAIEDASVREFLKAWPADGAGGASNGHSGWGADPARRLLADVAGEATGLDSASANGSVSSPLKRTHRPGFARATGRPGRVRALLRLAVTSRANVTLQVVLLAVVAAVMAANLLHWPATQFDEGTYIGDAWAVQYGRLGPYTYSYGHPPLAWLLIALWTWAGGLFGHASYSIDTGRVFMLAVNLASCSLLYALARRLSFGRVAAATAVILFGLSPLGLFWHRAVLLDNPSTAWALAAFFFAWTPRRRLWAFAASGACFAASVLCKETAIALLPALLVAAAQNTDRRTRRYCLALCGSFFALVGGFYPLYATLKGELLPGPGHVSLAGYLNFQLLTRKATGGLFDPHSQTHAIVAAWLNLDPWLLGIALILLPVALMRRTTRAVALAFLIQAVTLLRPGYLPNMYVIGLLPFAALIVAGGIEALWRGPQVTMASVLTWSMRAAISALAVALVVIVGPRWARADQVAVTTRLDGPQRAAERWLVAHVGHHARLIVDDQYWIYLIEHGFDHHPMRGGFFSRTVVSYWPLDYDPAVKRAFPRGWREFNYIVQTTALIDTLNQTPAAAAALAHSRVVARFGQGTQLIEIRAIGTARPVTRNPAGTPAPARTPPRAKTPGAQEPAATRHVSPGYLVAPGDTLSGIAARYHVPGGWRALPTSNHGVIGGNPNLIYPRQRLSPP